ncbi:MAG: cystathionine gamma-synthase [Gammaproteobacteria bacterium]|nr:cystathionine gamma-synthase [Gammaproteobacteria bacterium]
MPSSTTRVVRAGLGCDDQYRAVVPPLHLTSTYSFDGFGQKGKYDYSRSGNPTRDALGDALAELEGGAGSTVTGSGMAAVNLVCQLLKPGDCLIAPHDCYGGTHRLLTALAKRGQFAVHFCDLTDVNNLGEVFALRPTMVLVETPSNPLLRITDLAAISKHCQRTDALLVADNTFLSPGWQTPIAFGADLVIHSTTKYLNGHSDVVGGAVVAATPELHEELDWWGNCVGCTGAPFDSFLTLRGLRTLHSRLRSHAENAQVVAEYLQAHELVERVYFPGLADHPGHSIAKRQQSGFGAMISFELAGGVSSAAAMVDGLEYFFLAESLGGVESLIAHPATMTHAAMDEQARKIAGIGDNLLRLSVGIEDADDLVTDLALGLQRVESSLTPLRSVAAK